MRPLGRVFGPDPATSSVTTVGSMIAIDAAGSRWLKYGSTRRHVQSLQVVLADGQVLEVGREPLADGVSTSAIPRKRDLVNRLAALLTEQGRADPPASAQQPAEPLRLQPGRRARRRTSSTWPGCWSARRARWR